MKRGCYLIFIVISIFLVENIYALPVFPGAEGFGSETQAGRYGNVIKVTNLKDYGKNEPEIPGSFRWAVSQEGSRVVVFEVSGNINLKDRLQILNPYITIAGQTAPSPGITLIGRKISIKTHDVLMQHIRIRIGDDSKDPTPGTLDGLSISGSGRLPDGKCGNPKNKNDPYGECVKVHNVVVDHVSVSWSIDENIEVWGNLVYDVTISNSINGEGLFKSKITPEKEGHSMGFIYGSGPSKVSLVKNLFAHNAARNPYFDDPINVAIINNLAYNTLNVFTDLGSSKNFKADNVIIIGNVNLPGPDTIGGLYKHSIYIRDSVKSGSKIYVEDNPCISDNSGGWNCVYSENNNDYSGIKINSYPDYINDISILRSEDVEDYVINNVGARPLDRDLVDTRIINSLINKNGKIINSQNEVGGVPNLKQNYRELTIPNNPNGDPDENGYTNLDEWLFEYSCGIGGPCLYLDENITLDNCGNYIIEDDEDCDSLNLNNQTCDSLGYENGILSCNSECKFDVSLCEDSLIAKIKNRINEAPLWAPILLFGGLVLSIIFLIYRVINRKYI